MTLRPHLTWGSCWINITPLGVLLGGALTNIFSAQNAPYPLSQNLNNKFEPPRPKLHTFALIPPKKSASTEACFKSHK